ncbi:MAG: DUF2905 domain-containing protein [Deltaproteobacteria bacterium]|nr:DUF2905 domain-containing protein [Deltaproteobacteria bacterium]
MAGLGRLLIYLGLAVAGVGLLLSFASRLPWLRWLGHLPGDIAIERENFSFYFPLVSCMLVSAIISLIVYWVKR